MISMKDDLEQAVERVHRLGGKVHLFEKCQGMWVAGVYFHGGRRYEWASSPSMEESLCKVIEIIEKETCYGLA